MATLPEPEILLPVLITFNRAEALRATLEAFSRSAFSHGPFLVLDNASTDHTAEVVASFQAAWPGLRRVRNRHNIGGPANILRAVEAADSRYLWVIGDDDRWFLDDPEELFAVLRAGAADVIRLGWLVQDGHRGRTLGARELSAREPMLFASLSMISATIVRRELFIRHLPSAYTGTGDAYPQLVPLLRAYDQADFSVHTLARDLMVHTPSTVPGYFFHDLEWLSCWFRNARFLSRRRDRVRFLDEIMHYLTPAARGRSRENRVIVAKALQFKGYGVPQGRYLMNLLTYGDGRRLAVALALLAYALVPGRLALWWDDRSRRRRGLPAGQAREVFARRARERLARL
jgi:glycosyltransferase involved in cell wall biosynthesis